MRWPAAVVPLLVLALAACGGGGSTRYSRPAFVSCMQLAGARTMGIGQMPTAVKRLFAQLGSLNFAAAQLPDGEEGGFFFAQNDAGAKAIVAKLQRFAKTGAASPGQVIRKGNMALLMPPHPTAGFTSSISKCEASARVT